MGFGRNPCSGRPDNDFQPLGGDDGELEEVDFEAYAAHASTG